MNIYLIMSSGWFRGAITETKPVEAYTQRKDASKRSKYLQGLKGNRKYWIERIKLSDGADRRGIQFGG